MVAVTEWSTETADWRVLVIDDQIGAEPVLQEVFAKAVGAPLERFVFITGQVSGKNCVEEVERVVQSGWPSHNGTRWSLIYLDVHFDQVRRTVDDANFGFAILEMLRRKFGSDLPVVVLTSEDELKKSRSNRSEATSFMPKPAEWRADVCRDAHDMNMSRYGMYPDDSGRCRGISLPFLRVLRSLRASAVNGERNILLLGSSGSGKSWLGRFYHEASRRSGEYVTAFADPGNPSLEGTRLFGQWHGTFTGAEEGNFPGTAERAHFGTLFLDEIAELAPTTQAQLLEYRDTLRAPAEYDGWRRIERRGTYEAGERWARRQARAAGGRWQDHLNLIGIWSDELARVLVDSLLVTATNRDITSAAVRRAIGFRDDLAFAIAPAHATIVVPTLSERRDEIPSLFMSFLQERRRTTRREDAVLEPDASAALSDYDWPDNFRGLASAVASVDQSLGTFREVTLARVLPFFNSVRVAGGGSRGPEILVSRDANEDSIPDVQKRHLDPSGLLRDEVRLMAWTVESLLACFDESIRADPHSLPDLKPVMQRLLGVSLQPAEPQRELKRILDPILGGSGNAVARRRFGSIPDHQALVIRCQSDAALCALYSYSIGKMQWPEAAKTVVTVLARSDT
jgi:hypothetical protein